MATGDHGFEARVKSTTVYDEDTAREGVFEYQAMCELAEQGIDNDFLIENFESELKRFSLDVALGEFDIEIREARPGEHPLTPVAEEFLNRAVCYPPQTSFYGLEIAGKLNKCLTKLAYTHWRDVFDLDHAHITPEVIAAANAGSERWEREMWRLMGRKDPEA